MKKQNDQFMTQQISIEQLKMQNVSLYHQLDFNKKNSEICSSKNSQNEKIITNYQTLFTYFFGSLKAFMCKLENIHMLVKKQTADSKLSQRFPQCFEILLEISTITDKLPLEVREFKIISKDKCYQFTRVFENIYTELLIEQSKFNQFQVKILRAFLDGSDINETCRIIYQDSIDTKNRYKDFENFFKEKQSYLQFQEILESDNLQQRINDLQAENQNLKLNNENLSRRIRFISMQEEQGYNQDNWDCLCGSKQVYFTLSKTNSEVENRNFDPKMIENLKNLESLVGQLTEQKQLLIKENKKIKIQEKNLEEFFFNSEVYKNLLSQGQELARYCQTLKDQLILNKQRLDEIEILRIKEVTDIIRKEQEDKIKLLEEIKLLKLNKLGVEGADQFQYILREFDIAAHTRGFQQKNEEQEKTIAHLLNQIGLLRNKEADSRKRAESEQKQRLEYMQKYQILEQQLIIAQSKTGENNIEAHILKHPKIKEILIEISNIMIEKGVKIQDKIQDIINYIKTRESKIQSYEEKIIQYKNEINQQKKTQDQLLNEMENTDKGFNDLQESNRNMNTILKKKEESEANLIQEKFRDRLQQDLERKSLSLKIQADQEEISKQYKQIDELKRFQEQYTRSHDITMTERETLKTQNREFSSNLDEQLKFSLILKTDLQLLSKKYNLTESLLNETLEKFELTQTELTRIRSNGVQFQQPCKWQNNEEIDTYKEMFNCSVCKLRLKNIMLVKCGHLFCKDCVEEQVKVRNRSCQVCKIKFEYTDVKQIIWN